MRRVQWIGVLCLLLVGTSLLSTPTALAEKPARRLLAIADLYRLDSPQSVSLSPDGQRAVYSRHWSDPVTRQERTPGEVPVSSDETITQVPSPRSVSSV